MYVGGPGTVARSIAGAIRTLDVRRFDLVYSTGPVAASARLRAVELYGKEVIPMVKELLASAT